MGHPLFYMLMAFFEWALPTRWKNEYTLVWIMWLSVVIAWGATILAAVLVIRLIV